MKVLVVEPKHSPYLLEIGSELKSLQNAVKGDIKIIYPLDEEQNICYICNEVGKNETLPLNRALSFDEETHDVIAGTFLICESKDGKLIDLNIESAKKYFKLFKQPEEFWKAIDGKICTRKTTETLTELVFRKPINEDILSHLNYKSMHKQSTINCCDENQIFRHDKELEIFLSEFDNLDICNRPFVVKVINFDAARQNQKPSYNTFENFSEMDYSLEGYDFKNGVDVGISNDGGIAYVVYGSNYSYYDYQDTDKVLIVAHPIKSNIRNFEHAVTAEEYEKLIRKDIGKELEVIRNDIKKSFAHDKKKEMNRER